MSGENDQRVVPADQDHVTTPAMPTIVRLLGQTFSIECVDSQHEALASHADMPNIGTVRLTRQRILLADDLAPDQERDTVLHEILHCLCRIINLVPKGTDEERLVVALAPLLLDTLRRNPELVEYLVA